MGIGNIFAAFQPKDKVFFVLFEKITALLVEMSDEFHKGIQEFDVNDDFNVAIIGKRENLDQKALEKMGDFEELTLEEVFNF